MVRLLDKNLDGDCRDSGELFWQLDPASWGAQFSTVAVIDQNAVLVQRMRSTSYGVGTHRWPHEVNNTGGVTTSGSTSDYGVIDGLAQANSGAGTPINDPYGNYNVAADLNRDGVIDSTDTSIFTSTFGGAKSALASGLISDPSGPDNPFGYDGYVYNPDQGLYTVRFRWYSASYGRWLQRDPAGYVDGMNYYEYASGRTTSFADPSGLYVGVNGGKNFRSAVEKALSRLCPGTKVKQNGRLEIPKPDEKPKNEGGGEVCDAEECNNPPGCELLRKLEETNYAIPIVETGGEPGTDLQWERNEEESGIVHPTINYNPKYNRPIDKRRGDGQRVIDRNAEAWETLWHELVHVDRSRRGLHPLRWGVNDKDLTPLQRAIEELETIEATNKLYDWERKCVKLPEIMGPEKPGRPRLEQPVHPANRDPWGHPFVDPVWRDTQNYPGIRKME